MSMERLDRHVDAYVTWKRDLIREITRYRSWLAHNRLSSEAVDARLERALRVLRTDHITLAFVGEYSRGKTELINSLFFSSYGQRILPSRAGRTTMCPTELLFDPRSERSYIRLLPIESRLEDTSIAQLKRTSRLWLNLPLDPRDPQSMAEAFAQVAQTKTVPVEQAIALGFDPATLESVGGGDNVLVPAWRHAMVNFDHPLLRQGLRILDTPGLNALGSEPELTLSMLPNAQAIVFLLSADTGVTASDMQIWQQHIRQLDEDTQNSLFAVLNKIDVLWDDVAGEAFVQNAIEQIRETTAQQLGIDAADVLPLSAKQALMAKIRGDQALLERSQLAELEQLLSQRILAQKERLLEDQVVLQVMALIQNSQHALRLRLEKVIEQRDLLASHQQGSGQMLLELTARTRHEHNRHHKRLLDLKTNQRLLQRQGELLRAAIRAERLEEHLTRLRRSLTGSLTTLGINLAILHFFRSVEQDLGILEQEAERANKMVSAIYRRHSEENPLHGIDPPLFQLQPYQRELRALQGKADQFRLQLKTLLTEQRTLTRRFFATLVQEVIGLHQRLRQEAERWSGDALTPLLQFSLEHKQQLETHMLRLKSLAKESQQNSQRGQLLTRYSGELEQQLTQAAEMLRALRRPAPLRRQSKVVSLSSVQIS
ncbi:dynamin-like GTPase family protein [Stutzerimonas sp. Brlt_13]|uniref:Dynamin-like GTPase family protein n=2 Tax=Stutzerimonas stutzeri TaxID=316 RepID=A0AA42PC61_STUST|nr:dynamin-like GTPase family protein [Stutzerimonas stutzeri]MBW8336837.1 dynamin-like GTPase family protein [Pseudomonas sp.]MDH0057804.1 dynamin-like GTPase family protein [Stutzerimonas stutzeri]MDH0687898.1 dynamin-like GTPase family protein [Stutzerimonas stutzeri]MDH0728362.1 dynamin-like GTPase family protein [Stutzerimonas stutzeri]MDH1236419.1 dynamin-like GTPase family protein [Stutzerimonas stutzeri]